MSNETKNWDLSALNYENQNDLFEVLGSEQMDIMLDIDFDKKEISARTVYHHERGSCSSRNFNGLEYAFKLNFAVDATGLKDYIEDNLLDLLDSEKFEADYYNGCNLCGQFPDLDGYSLQYFLQKIDDILIDAPKIDGWLGVFYADEFLEYRDDINITAETTDEEIEKFAEKLEDEAKDFGYCINSFSDYLTAKRDDLIDE